MIPSSAKIVICGAGIAGIAAAHALMRDHGARDIVIVEEGAPLSLTSDKSTEAYRNWWPGPDMAMTAFMNRSLDQIEAIARRTDNRINMNRRGYVFATADVGKLAFLEEMARSAEGRGGGEARFHASGSNTYVPSPERGFDFPLTGADVLTDAGLIRRHFPYMSEDTVGLVHARRAGWLSAQQLGAIMLEEVRARGARFLAGRVVEIAVQGGAVRAVEVDTAGGRETLPASHLILAAGPMQAEVARLAGVELPIFTERHFKVGFQDRLNGLPREAPMLVWLDEQRLPWTEEERAALAEDEDASWLLRTFPGGVHGRPDGSATLILFNHHGEAVEPVFPLPDPSPHYAEIALRAMSTMVPGLRAYEGGPPRTFVDGGYYARTRENRPLIGPVPVGGVHVSCGYSGFGIMASCAGGDLVARHVAEAPLPEDAPAFLPSRYGDPRYLAALETWGDGGQL